MHLQDSPTPADSPIKLSNPLWEQTLWPDRPPRTALEAAHCAKQPRLEGFFAAGQAVSPAAEPPAGAAEQLNLPTLAAGIEGRPKSGANAVDHTQLAADNSADRLDLPTLAAGIEGHSTAGGASTEAVAHSAQQQVQMVEQLNGAADIGGSEKLGAADLEAGPHIVDSTAMSSSVENLHANKQEQIASAEGPASAEPVSGTPTEFEDSLAIAMKPDIRSERDGGGSKLECSTEPLSVEPPQELKEASAASSSAITIEWPAADNHAARPLSELPGLEDHAVLLAENKNQLAAKSKSSEAPEVQPLKDEEQVQESADLHETQPGQHRGGEASGDYLCATHQGHFVVAAHGQAPAQLHPDALHPIIGSDRWKRRQSSHRLLALYWILVLKYMPFSQW